jgi:glycosyltransferase involved in cell wall biosynthesis
VNIVHVTPHLPPDQAANALLPFQLGEWARARGDAVHYIANPPVSGTAGPREEVTWIARTKRSWLQRVLRLGSVSGARRIRNEGGRWIASADVVHIHSNGLLPEVAAMLARRCRRPTVLTLYGTEIWHYRRKRGIDLFTSAYRHAGAVTFYSQGLLDRARELGLERPRTSVIYPAVASSFAFHDEHAKQAVRRSLGIAAQNLLVNVKRLHPLAGQRFLLDAMPAIVREHPDTHLVICGTGTLMAELQAIVRRHGMDRHVTFAGLVDNAVVARYCAAADLFVLPSVLEALPTVAVEALASGTPVVSSDNPGGVELHGIFGDDVDVVPRERPEPLARAIVRALRNRRRTNDGSARAIERRFRAEAVAQQYWDVYAAVMRLE